MKMITALISFIILHSDFSFAGGSIAGDGGHGVVCSKPRKIKGVLYYESVEVLDLYEAHRSMGLRRTHSRLAAGNLRDARISVCRALAAKKTGFQKLFGSVAADVSESFDQACWLVKRVAYRNLIPATHDHGPISVEIPKSCYLVQLGRRTVINNREKYALAYETIFNLTHVELEALVLHEALHKHFNQDDTRAVRQLVGFVFLEPHIQERNRELFTELMIERKPVDLSRFIR